MKRLLSSIVATLAVALAYNPLAQADSYDDAISTFKDAGKSGTFFAKAYAYAVFPTVGDAGFIVGAAHGKGRVYVAGVLTGDSSMTLVSAGLQAGAKAYSEIVFFEDKRALDTFESGNFEFGADASAGTTGVSTGASGDSSNANTGGSYHDGMAVFTVAKGGLMYAARISGQKFTYTPRGCSRP